MAFSVDGVRVGKGGFMRQEIDYGCRRRPEWKRMRAATQTLPSRTAAFRSACGHALDTLDADDGVCGMGVTCAALDSPHPVSSSHMLPSLEGDGARHPVARKMPRLDQPGPRA